MEFKAVDSAIMARRTDELFGMGPVPGSKLPNQSIRLQLDHPAYSATYALAMASMMNRKQLDV